MNAASMKTILLYQTHAMFSASLHLTFSFGTVTRNGDAPLDLYVTSPCIGQGPSKQMKSFQIVD